MWLDKLKDDLKEELHDAIKYANMSREAHGGDRQILHDMAKEEYTHAKHLCQIMREHGMEHEHGALMEQAREAVWG